MQDADAFFCNGHCYERGLYGCEMNLEVAARLILGLRLNLRLWSNSWSSLRTSVWIVRYRLAAEKGHTVAQWRLGELLELLAKQTLAHVVL